MNLFLLLAVPAAGFLIVWHYLDNVSHEKAVLNLASSFAWAFVVFFAFLPFYGLTRYDSGLVPAFFGEWILRFLLPPAVLLGLFSWRHVLIKKEISLTQGQQLQRLTYWLGLFFTIQGLGDFLLYNRSYDMTELFFVPLLRILLLAWLPILFLYFWNSHSTGDKVRWSLAAAGLSLFAGLCVLLSYAQLGLVVWAILILAFAASWFALNRFYRK